MCSLGTHQRDWNWSDSVVMRRKNKIQIPCCSLTSRWRILGLVRSLTKLRDRFQGQAIFFHLREEERGKEGVRKQEEQGQGQ